MNNEGCFAGAVAVIIILCVIAYGILSLTAAISVGDAMARFEEMNPNASVEVIRHSNNLLFLGNPYDVTFELEVNGRPVSARCTAGRISPMICRIYGEGGE